MPEDTAPGQDALALNIAKVSIVHNDLFYLDFVIFLVENEYFRLPRRNLIRTSEAFSHMFDVPSSSNPEGLTDENPIHLDQVKKDDFIQLLRVIYPEFGEEETLTLDQWISVLKMADHFICDQVRLHAISKLAPLLESEPALKFKLATDYHVDGWKLPALNMLAQRAEPMGMKDVDLLGDEAVLKLIAIRDRAVMHYSSWNGQTTELVQDREEVLVDCSTILWDEGLLTVGKPKLVKGPSHAGNFSGKAKKKGKKI